MTNETSKQKSQPVAGRYVNHRMGSSNWGENGVFHAWRWDGAPSLDYRPLWPIPDEERDVDTDTWMVVGGPDGEWRLRVGVRRGRPELYAEKGDWIVLDPWGDVFVVPGELFEGVYSPAPEPEEGAGAEKVSFIGVDVEGRSDE